MFRTLAYLEPSIFKSLSNMLDDQVYSEPCHSQNSFFKHFHRYSGIFRSIDAYLATLTGPRIGRKEEPSSALSLKIKKMS